MEDTRFGIILLENPFMRREDVERCLKLQALGGRRKPIGEILLEEGLINERTLQLVLAIQERRRKLLAAAERAEGEFDDEQPPELPELLERAERLEATDLFLGEGRRPLARVCGRLVPLSEQELDREWLERFLGILLGGRRSDPLAGVSWLLGNLLGPGAARPRVIVHRDTLGLAAVVRLLPAEIPEPEELGFGEAAGAFLEQGRGLVLVCGEARSGRTTALASLTQRVLAGSEPRHVLVADRTLEYRFESGRSLLSLHRLGARERARAEVLAACFQEDADVVVTDDLARAEEVELAVQAAESGRLVLAGVRARGAVEAVRALIEAFPAGRRRQAAANLASCLSGVLHRDLVPARDGRRLVPACEILTVGPEEAAAIAALDFERLRLLLGLGDSDGRKPLDESLWELVEAGEIELEEAFGRARDRSRLLAAAGREEVR